MPNDSPQKDFSPYDSIFNEIKEERAYQDRKWGGAEHDDQHDAYFWVALVVRYLGKAATLVGFDLSGFSRQMTKAAACCVAAIQWSDRMKLKQNFLSDLMRKQTERDAKPEE